MPIQLNILHFNDVYRVTKQKIEDKNGKQGTIDVTQFATLLQDRRMQWSELANHDGQGKARDGLVLFSGDLFSPSVESSVTRGSHMVPLMNELAPDCALAGNHVSAIKYHSHGCLINAALVFRTSIMATLISPN